MLNVTTLGDKRINISDLAWFKILTGKVMAVKSLLVQNPVHKQLQGFNDQAKTQRKRNLHELTTSLIYQHLSAIKLAH